MDALANIPKATRPASPLDEFEAMLATMQQVEFPLTHSFTPGIVIRQCFLPAGSLLTSMEHLTEHHFIIISGTVDVISAFERNTYVGPHMGITKPGTRRVLYAHTDTLWLTIHANPENITDLEDLAASVVNPNANPLIDAGSLDFRWHELLNPNGTIMSEEILKLKGQQS